MKRERSTSSAIEKWIRDYWFELSDYMFRRISVDDANYCIRKARAKE